MDRFNRLVSGNPRVLVGAMLALAGAFWFAMGASALFAHQVLDGVPDRSSLTRVTEMARSSVFYDHKGRPAFTIFKEQRIEVPLDRISPHLKKAMLAIEDQRFYDHHGVDIIRIAGAAVANLREGRRGAGRQHHHAAARAHELPHARTRPTRASCRKRCSPRSSRTSTRKDQILELYLNKVYFGAGLLRRRSRGARLLRQARRRAYRGRGGAARRPREGAVELRADRQSRARPQAPHRGAAGDARDRARSTSRRSSARAATKVVAERRAAQGRAVRPLLQGARPPRARRRGLAKSASTKAA